MVGEVVTSQGSGIARAGELRAPGDKELAKKKFLRKSMTKKKLKGKKDKGVTVINFKDLDDFKDFSETFRDLRIREEKGITIAEDHAGKIFGYYNDEEDNILFDDFYFENLMDLSSFYLDIAEAEVIQDFVLESDLARSLVMQKDMLDVNVWYDPLEKIFKASARGDTAGNVLFQDDLQRMAVWLAGNGAELSTHSSIVNPTAGRRPNRLKAIDHTDFSNMLEILRDDLPGTPFLFKIFPARVSEEVEEATNFKLPGLTRNLGKSMVTKTCNPCFRDLSDKSVGGSSKVDKVVVKTHPRGKGDDSNHEIAFVFDDKKFYPLPVKGDTSLTRSNMNVFLRSKNNLVDDDVLDHVLNTPGVHHIRFNQADKKTNLKTTIKGR